MTTLLFLTVLILAGITDAGDKKISDIFPLSVIALAIPSFAQSPDSLSCGLAGFTALGIPMLVLALFRGGLGGGDIKLSAACGLYLGFDAALAGVFIAGVLALTIHGIPRLSRKKKGGDGKNDPPTAFAFGPYLAAGFIAAALL